MQNPTLDSSVREIIEWWLPRVYEVLDDHQLSIVLYGSVTLGDFQPGWSDIDVCVVLSEPVTEDTGSQLGHIHDLMRQRYLEKKHEGWASGQVVESNYIPLELASASRDDLACYIAGGTTRKWQYGDPYQPFDRYMLANHRQIYAGRDVFFLQPSIEELSFQAETDVRSLSEWETQSAIWLTGMLHWLARSLVFWREGVMFSKTAALQNEIMHSSPYSEAFDLALTIRRKGSANAAVHLEELRNHYSRFAESFTEELRKFVAEKKAPNQALREPE